MPRRERALLSSRRAFIVAKWGWGEKTSSSPPKNQHTAGDVACGWHSLHTGAPQAFTTYLWDTARQGRNVPDGVLPVCTFQNKTKGRILLRGATKSSWNLRFRKNARQTSTKTAVVFCIRITSTETKVYIMLGRISVSSRLAQGQANLFILKAWKPAAAWKYFNFFILILCSNMGSFHSVFRALNPNPFYLYFLTMKVRHRL